MSTWNGYAIDVTVLISKCPYCDRLAAATGSENEVFFLLKMDWVGISHLHFFLFLEKYHILGRSHQSAPLFIFTFLL